MAEGNGALGAHRLAAPAFIIALVALAFGLQWAAAILVPLAYALLILSLAWPFREWTRRRMADWVSLVLTLMLLLAFLGMLGVLAIQVQDALDEQGEQVNALCPTCSATSRKQASRCRARMAARRSSAAFWPGSPRE